MAVTASGPLAGRVVRDPLLLDFAAEVGGPDDGPVTVVGGRSQWEVGGPVAPDAREVVAPSGLVEFEPAEMTARARAGTTVAALNAELAEGGQMVALPEPAPGATVGGVLAVGRSDVRRLGRGPLRETLLQARYVSADGLIVTAGGPTVKNVTGFDLCRLLVGSLGTIGLLAEVTLRTRPVPEAATWLSGEADPFALRAALYRPTSLLWDGTRTWVLLEGREADVAAQAAIAHSHGLVEVASGPTLPPHRRSMRPGDLRQLGGASAAFVAEVGVGLVHQAEAPPPSPPGPAVADLNRRVRQSFDPTGRLNPGRDPLRP
jgi:glycolate oxidase FAD binding subunit